MVKTEKFNKFFNKFIYIFLLLSPVLDALTALFVKNTNFPISIGTIIRGLLLLFVIIYIKNNTNSKKILLIFVLYILLAIIYYLGLKDINIVNEVVNLFKIFYLPIMMLFFSKYNNEKIDDKLIVKIYLLYLNLIIIPYLFGFSNSLSESYSNKNGEFGLFFGGNELSAIIIGLGLIVLEYVNNSKNYILKIVVFIELFVSVVLIGTKTVYVGMFIIILYMLFKFLYHSRIYDVEKYKKKMLLILLFFTIGLIVILPKTPLMSNIKTTLDYYKVNEVKDLLNIKTIDNVIFSRRLSNANKIIDPYFNTGINTLIYGISRTKLESINVIEIDILDIFFTIGFFGIIIYILMCLYTTKFNYLNNKYNFCKTMFILISIFSGHVLIQPMVSIYIALLYILNKNSIKIEKKRILLVSNMYPSDKYKYYGSFVKNTEEVLLKNGFEVDRIVMSKQTEKIAKLFSYLYLYIGTILKGIFNNYDYIYVHFVSHSSLGANFVKKTSRDVKLILNAHGNDVIADTKIDEKNVKKSKKYIRNADMVIVPSNYFKDVITSNYDIDDDKVFVYPSGGVDTNKFKAFDKKEAKKELGLSNDYNYIGFVSRLEKNKGYDVFLKSIKELVDREQIDKYRFLIVGAGSEENKFHDLVNELNIKDYLEIRNMVSQEELINIYNSLDMFVFPTYRKSESLGLVGLEAMACEVIVLASKNYGPTDYVNDKKNGLFFKPKDYKDLADKILEVNKMNNEEIKKMKKKARETAIRYDSKNTKELILKVFK